MMYSPLPLSDELPQPVVPSISAAITAIMKIDVILFFTGYIPPFAVLRIEIPLVKILSF
jgi:hypothetical protein